MKPMIQRRLERLVERHEELAGLLAEPSIASDGDKFRRYSVEYSELESVVTAFRAWRHAQDELAAAEQMAGEADADMRALAAEEATSLRAQLPLLEEALQRLLVPKDPLDGANVFLEIRAAAGGDEAAIFAGDLFRMYSRYAAQRGWQVEVVNSSAGEHGGYREIIARVAGGDVYSRLKFESGTHRVQRVPATEAQGRVHTSTCTVAVLAEPPEVEAVDIRKDDLKVDTFRSSGAGGQHVNVTESAIRITHIPSGIIVECQDERSQHKNRARAMSLLAAKLLSSAQEAQTRDTAQKRRLQVGTGDR
ncbi:MAG: peptide chain release factor 1, partial [Actinomycetota bacterium]|nr:peptide chain release factor 1 [Actinomycetota bacterium]